MKRACSGLFAGLVLAVFSLIAGAGVSAEVVAKPFLSPIFSDDMVLQREKPLPVWGWTEPGREVTVEIEGKLKKGSKAVRKATVQAGADGKWMAKIGPFVSGGPCTVTVTDGTQTQTIQRVVLGDVWICSGQSNMDMGIGVAKDAESEIAAADYPMIRLFKVGNKVALEPQETLAGKWVPCSSNTIGKGGWGGFSAVGYYFGRHLHSELDVPVGLISSAWGGTIAEAWASLDALKSMEDFRKAVERVELTSRKRATSGYSPEASMEAWWRENDPGSTNGLGWADPALDTNEWGTMILPCHWEKGGFSNFNGIGWVRKVVDLPDDWAGKKLRLHLGPVDDFDTTWINGVAVGGMGEWNVPRVYDVAETVMKPGRNVIAIRILDTGGLGGIFGAPGDMRLEIPDQTNVPAISLAGAWSCRISASLMDTTICPLAGGNDPNVVGVLYNGMIAPMVPFAIKGAIWYQGESNVGRDKQYRELLPLLINDWRARFEVGEFPFLIVQLANYMKVVEDPSNTEQWPALREAQCVVSRKVPNTALAVAIDIGDAMDIHPKNKQDVGKRLGLAAEAVAYGCKVEYSGPVYRNMEISDSTNTVRLFFDHVGKGLVAKGEDGVLRGFAVAGADGKYEWADASIDKKTVIVSSPKVEKPVAVRYGWANNPVCNLYNKADLPAVPFRTDAP